MAELKIPSLTNQQYNSLRNKFNNEIEELESVAKRIEKILELKERIRELKDEISFGLDSLNEDLYESLLFANTQLENVAPSDYVRQQMNSEEVKLSKREDNIIEYSDNSIEDKLS